MAERTELVFGNAEKRSQSPKKIRALPNCNLTIDNVEQGHG